MRILNQAGESLSDELRRAFPQVEVVDVPLGGAIDPSLTGDLLIANHISDNIEVLAERVPWVHVVGTGIDGVAAAVLHRPTVTCARGSSAVPAAEYVMLALLAREKDVDTLWVNGPPTEWWRAELGVLERRRLGLVGFGGIGKAVATRALAFSMEVRAVRRSATPSELEGVEIVDDLHALLRWADHVVLAAPATARSRHLLDDRSLAHAKPGLHVVNVARGSLIDQEALRRALDDGRVAFATLDVADPEPLPAGHWLYTHDRVRLSPHVSWSSPQLEQRTSVFALENVRRYLAGEPLQWIVDPVEGY